MIIDFPECSAHWSGRRHRSGPRCLLSPPGKSPLAPEADGGRSGRKAPPPGRLLPPLDGGRTGAAMPGRPMRPRTPVSASGGKRFILLRAVRRRPYRRSPRKAVDRVREACLASDETNRKSDESSPQSVIYSLASPRRRGTIGGGSTAGGTPIICIWLEVADFRRPSHMGTGKPCLRPKITAPATGLDARIGASP